MSTSLSEGFSVLCIHQAERVIVGVDEGLVRVGTIVRDVASPGIESRGAAVAMPRKAAGLG